MKLCYIYFITQVLIKFKNSGNNKEQKVKDLDPQDISRIFFIAHGKIILDVILLSHYETLMQKIINDEIRPEDFQEIWKYMKIINTIIFAVVLDYYIWEEEL